ncbi:alpha/beta fold hydrolase [Actinokineospora bangkokensis]|uniref:AB hydrolase-1 domain-containing protein n=1 Tax=Actinokineospora bangkokensis TaxID=1193682 RepID=A0A1Q9LSP1_9PSEU|nr:alpha/beta fold hydrolase [Actinokineospora bangkokensis]OLR95055.1 hypothetical protein BJP25_08880 [Actinokineospora bangkokensis]
MEHSIVTVDGQRVAYLDSSPAQAPAGAPPVVLVHGNSSSTRTWLPLLRSGLGSSFRCLALDLPGHGGSEPVRDEAGYSLPRYAALLTGFARELDVSGAVFVGWSLGGQIVLEAAPGLPDARGFAVFGTAPIGTPADMAEAFLPNPAMGALFSDEVSEDEARVVAASFTAPGSPLDLSEFVEDILATDGAARTGLAASAGAGQFADEFAILSALRLPLAVLHGAEEQLINFDYLRGLDFPALWRNAVQVVPGAGHAPHQEAPARFAALLTEFILDVG